MTFPLHKHSAVAPVPRRAGTGGGSKFAACIFLFFVTCASAQPFLNLPVVQLQFDTNLYYLNFKWDAVTNATSYSLDVFSNSVLQQMVACSTNYASVSNLPSALDGWRFVSTAINQSGVSGYSLPAPLHWTIVLVSTDLVTWAKAPAVEFDPLTNAQSWLRLSNWSYATELHRQ